ncbi:MAG TPA: DUF1565 domain-containing protein, partial [bacterium]|nr:DUF1565 domain-containing protein [bacterium]
GDPSDPVPPGGGSRIDMGCYEYQYTPQLFIESVIFTELSGDGDGIPEAGETIQPEIILCNYGEPATGMTVTYTLNHPDITMIQSQVSVGDMAFDECRTVAGPTFSVSGPSGWCIPVELTGDWISGTDTGTFSIPFSLHGIEMHVDPETGSNDTGTGSSSNPFKTIGFARDRCRGNRLYPLTIRAHAGVYSNETNGETWPLYLDEYEDLAGDGTDTELSNRSLVNQPFIYPGRSSNLTFFSVSNHVDTCYAIKAVSITGSEYHQIQTVPMQDQRAGIYIFGSSALSIHDCSIPAVSCGTYEIGDDVSINNCYLFCSMLVGNCVFENNYVDNVYGEIIIHKTPGSLSNSARFNIMKTLSRVTNVNDFSDNYCLGRGVYATTNTSYDMARNVCVDAGFGLWESNESINLINCIALELGFENSRSYYSDTGPGWNCINCINLPFVYNMDAYSAFDALYAGFTVDGCTALFNRAGIDFYYCASTRNAVSYYNHRDASDCWNTRYSDMVNCPDPDNIDADPGFIGISTITDIGFNWFADNTAAWEPDRYTGYYVNPNIFNNDALFYCIGNTEDTIYVIGDPRTAAEIGDRFVIPDLRLRRIADGFAYDSPLIDAGDPAETDPDGSRRDIGPYGGPYARTPMPVIPTWPPPEHTP